VCGRNDDGWKLAYKKHGKKRDISKQLICSAGKARTGVVIQKIGC
jgi:hypothetical protein